MPRGVHVGARAAPDPDALRRDRKDDQATWVDLPAEGRQGPPPVWPLSDPSEREVELWAKLWRRPQAVMWESLEAHDTVALYVRRHVEAEEPGASAALTGRVLSMGDALGLSAAGLRAHRWRVVAEETSPSRQARARAPKASRDRFTVVDGGA